MFWKKISEYGFRELVGHYVLISADERKLKAFSPEFQWIDGDNAMLGYGYIDHQAGLTVELLCAAKYEENHIELRDGREDTTVKLRYGSIDGKIMPVPYHISMAKFAKKVEIVSEHYCRSNELKEIRKYEALDQDRHPQYPDDVLALLFKPNVKNERIWVRTECIIDGKVVGRLLNQPHSAEFGLNAGDIVKLVYVSLEKGRLLLIDTPDLYQ